MSNCSTWPIDRTLSGANTPGQSGPVSIGNEGVLCFPQSSRISWAPPSDGLISYSGHSLGVSYPSTDLQSMYSADRADWTVGKKRCIYYHTYIYVYVDICLSVYCLVISLFWANSGVIKSFHENNTWRRSETKLLWFLMSYPGHLIGGVLPLNRDAIGISYSPSWLGLDASLDSYPGYLVTKRKVDFLFSRRRIMEYIDLKKISKCKNLIYLLWITIKIKTKKLHVKWLIIFHLIIKLLFQVI